MPPLNDVEFVGCGLSVGGKLTQCGGVNVDPSRSRERSSRSLSTTSIDGSGPPRSLAARHRAATNRSSASIRLKVAHARERRSARGWGHFTPFPANRSPRAPSTTRVAPNTGTTSNDGHPPMPTTKGNDPMTDGDRRTTDLLVSMLGGLRVDVHGPTSDNHQGYLSTRWPICASRWRSSPRRGTRLRRSCCTGSRG